MSRFPRHGGSFLALLALALFLTGCGQTTILGRTYANFTAYYNTFYNARQSFAEGERLQAQVPDPIDRRTYLSVHRPVRTAGEQQFRNAVEKSADVLRDHPTSRWVDDALLLIGKAYFYQQNFVGAEEKFREVIEIESVLADEARFWLGRTLMEAGSFEVAREHLLTNLEMDGLSRRWAPRLRLVLGELYVRQGAFEEAAAALETGLSDVRDREQAARGWFLLGQVYETLGRYEDAVEAFDRVEGFHPPYELSYAALFNSVRVEGVYVDPEAALVRLRRMERDDKHYPNRFELAYLRGRIYQAEGYAGDARETFYNVLYRSEAQLGPVRGQVHYALAELYRDAFRDYVIAAAHFDTARTSPQQQAPSSTMNRPSRIQYAPGAITDVQQQATMFASFRQVREEIIRKDSLLHLGSLSEEAFAEKVLAIRMRMAAEMAEQQRRAERLQAERGFQSTQAGARPGDAAAAVQTGGAGQAGFLFHRDPARVQEGRMNFMMRWGERPRVPNWRRMDAVIAAQADADGEDGDLEGMDPGTAVALAGAGLPMLDVSDVPRDSLSAATMRAQRAVARYELGNVLFLSMNQPDSAAYWYRTVIEENPEEPVARRAFYALAEVHQALGDDASARRLYEQVVQNFPESDFADLARERLGIERVVATDSLALAQEAYERAYAQWTSGMHENALNDMLALVAAHRSTDVVPKALLAAGRIYLEWAQKDSLDVLGPLPLSLPDSVVRATGLLSLDDPAVPEDALEDAVDVAEWDEDMPAWVLAERMETPGQVALPGEAAPDPPGAEPIPGAVPDPPGAEPIPGAVPDPTPVDPSIASPGAAPQPGDAPSPALPENVEEAVPGVVETPDADAAEAVPGVVETPEADAAGAAPGVVETPEADAAAVPGDVLEAAADDEIGVAETDALVPEMLLADARALDLGAELVFAAVDTVEEAPDDDVYVRTLYEAVQRMYPETAYAQQAALLLEALEARRYEMASAADTTDAGDVAIDFPGEIGIEWPGEVAQADAMAGADGADGRADDGDPAVSELPSGEASFRGPGGIRPELGGYTVVLGVDPLREHMEEIAAGYEAMGYRTGVVRAFEGDREVYRAVLGQFASMQDAWTHLQEIMSDIEDILDLVPLDGYELR